MGRPRLSLNRKVRFIMAALTSVSNWQAPSGRFQFQEVLASAERLGLTCYNAHLTQLRKLKLPDAPWYWFTREQKRSSL
jgi:hypothetical protein